MKLLIASLLVAGSVFADTYFVNTNTWEWSPSQFNGWNAISNVPPVAPIVPQIVPALSTVFSNGVGFVDEDGHIWVHSASNGIPFDVQITSSPYNPVLAAQRRTTAAFLAASIQSDVITNAASLAILQWAMTANPVTIQPGTAAWTNWQRAVGIIVRREARRLLGQ